MLLAPWVVANWIAETFHSFNALISGVQGQIWYQFIREVDKHAPVITNTFAVRPKVPWYDNSLKDLKKSRRKAESHWRKAKSNKDLETQFKIARNKCANGLANAKSEYYSNEISQAEGNQRKLYSIIQSLTTIKKDTPFRHMNLYCSLLMILETSLLTKLRK